MTDTYLYVKQHLITGKLYFGKTVKDPTKYCGSGIHWSRHVKKHGKEHVETLWYCLFEDQEELTKFALMCSEQWDIVKSDDWLNAIPEDGLDGGVLGLRHSEESKEKIGSFHRKPKSLEHRAKIGLGNKGKIRTFEQKQRTSQALTGKKQSEETIARRVSKNTGQKRSPETCTRISAALKARAQKLKEIKSSDEGEEE